MSSSNIRGECMLLGHCQMASRLLLMVTRLVGPRGRKHYKYFYSASVEYSLDVPTVQVMVTVQLEGLTLARG